MNTAKAQAVTTALIGANLPFTIRKVGEEFIIRVRSANMDIAIDVANQFCIDNSIAGKIQEIELS